MASVPKRSLPVPMNDYQVLPGSSLWRTTVLAHANPMMSVTNTIPSSVRTPLSTGMMLEAHFHTPFSSLLTSHPLVIHSHSTAGTIE